MQCSALPLLLKKKMKKRKLARKVTPTKLKRARPTLMKLRKNKMNLLKKRNKLMAKTTKSMKRNK